ncbi:unnamed protein product, partial [Rotaria sp. Silwood2]
MTTNDANNKVSDEFRLQLLLHKQQMEYELKKYEKEQDMKYKLEFDARKLIEETKRFEIKEREVEQTKRKHQHEVEETKRIKLQLEFDSSIIKKSLILFTSHSDFYNIYVKDNLKLFDINDLLKDNVYFNDNILTYVEIYLNNCLSNVKLIEKIIQAAFDILIVNLLNTFNNATLLQYLNTSTSGYLEDKFRPDCTFIYKNINISIETPKEFLEDFVVCVGDLKASNSSLTDKATIGEILQYLKIILDVQRREMIYGFLCNYKYMKFFYVEKKLP